MPDTFRRTTGESARIGRGLRSCLCGMFQWLQFEHLESWGNMFLVHSWFMSPTAQRIQGFIKKKTKKTDKNHFYLVILPVGLSFGDSVFDCLCVFVYLVKINFLCWSRGHNSWWTNPSLTWVQLSFWWLDHQIHRNCCAKSPQLSPLNHPYFLILSHHHPFGRHVIPLIAKKQRFVLVKSNMVVALVM